jgi:TRAP-type C4-dicarboxylate transport system substrate-binding protein
MIGEKYWNSLPADIQNMILAAWKQILPVQRQIAKDEFKKAEEIMKKNGVEFYVPPEKEAKEVRNILLSAQDEMASASKIDKDLYQSTKEKLSAIDRAAK